MDTRKSSPESRVFAAGDSSLPALLVAWAPPGAVDNPSRVVAPPFTVGRSGDSDLCIQDDKVSGSHLRITRRGGGLQVADLGSTNGTFLTGVPLAAPQPLSDGALLRVGRALLVFHENAGPLLEPVTGDRFGMAGQFHTATLLRQLREAALSARPVLLAGPSGTGKELAARALAAQYAAAGASGPLITHNAARFSSEEEATSTLFGVAPKVFSNVEARPGLLEEADGGTLFLDEVHNLPTRVQRSLLRFLEDAQYSRLGEVKPRRADVRLVLASNAGPPDHGLAHDLLARLRQVTLKPLCERVADIPALFDAVTEAALSSRNLEPAPVLSLLSGDHYEALCLDGFQTDNVRGLVDLADRLATRLAAGADAPAAVTTVFQERFAEGPVALRQQDSPANPRSHYEQNRERIIAAFRAAGGNLSATERALAAQGLKTSRRWLAVFLERWGVR